MRITAPSMLLTFFLLTAGLVWTGPALGQTSAGAALFHRGQYTEAYAALWPGLSVGDPEAIFYALIIRRNGLDGRAPAEPGEFSALWQLLAGQAERLRKGFRDGRNLTDETRRAYATALAQLDYFGPNLSSWPPPPDPARAKRVHLATKFIGPPNYAFTPAMNFLAFLDHDAHGGRQGWALSHTLRAAEAGDRLAMGNLAWFYRDGLGVGKNDLRAAYWAHRGCQSMPQMGRPGAAEESSGRQLPSGNGLSSPPTFSGLARNQNEMGYLYESGRGVTLDLSEAARWYEMSAAQGHPAGLSNAERLKKGEAGPPVLDNRVLF